MALGILRDPSMPLPLLLDVIAHSETGHLSPAEAAIAKSRKGARGKYQFLPKNLHSMGYTLPDNIPLSDILDPSKARSLAGQYVTGYSNYHNFKTPLEKLVAYNFGPTAAANWMASGGRIEDLPKETQDYLARAAEYANKSADGGTAMAQPLPSSSIAYGLDPDAYRQSLYNQLAGSTLPQSAIDDIVEKEMEAAFPPRANVTPPAPKPRSPEAQAALAAATAAITPPDNSITGQGNNNAILNQGLLAANYPNRGTGASVMSTPVTGRFGPGRTFDTYDVDDPADRRAIGLGQPPQPVEQITYAENFGYDRGQTRYPMDHSAGVLNPRDMIKHNAPNFGYDRGQTQYPMDHSAGVLNPTVVNTQYPMDHSAGILNPTVVNTQYPMDHSAAIVNPDPNPVLNRDFQPITSGSAASTVSGRRRDQSPMAYQPMTSTGDMLMRVGLAGVRGSQYGGLEALGAMGEEYGNIQDNEAQGLAAFQKAQAKAAAKNKPKNNSAKGTVVNDDIERALGLVMEDQGGFFSNLFKGDLPATGLFSLLSFAPGSDANLLKNRLQTIRANISFDKLQSMREESPTGGALGQVSTFELQNLMSVFGSLEQSQTADELAYNLRRVQKVYNDVIHGEGNHPYQMPARTQTSAPAASNDALNAADAVVGITQ